MWCGVPLKGDSRQRDVAEERSAAEKLSRL